MMAALVVPLMMFSLMSPFLGVCAVGPDFGEGVTFEVMVDLNTDNIIQCIMSRTSTLLLAALKVHVNYFVFSKGMSLTPR